MRGEHSPTDKHVKEKFSEDTWQGQSGLTVAGHRGGDTPYDSKVKEESTTPRERVPSGKSSMCKEPVAGRCVVSLRNKEDNMTVAWAVRVRAKARDTERRSKTGQDLVHQRGVLPPSIRQAMKS